MVDGVVPQMIGLTNVVGTTQDFPTEEKRRRQQCIEQSACRAHVHALRPNA